MILSSSITVRCQSWSDIEDLRDDTHTAHEKTRVGVEWDRSGIAAAALMMIAEEWAEPIADSLLARLLAVTSVRSTVTINSTASPGHLP